MKMNKVMFAALAFAVAASFSFDCQARYKHQDEKTNGTESKYSSKHRYRTEKRDGKQDMGRSRTSGSTMDNRGGQ